MVREWFSDTFGVLLHKYKIMPEPGNINGNTKIVISTAKRKA